MRTALLAAFAASILLHQPAAAHSAKVGPIELTDLWSRATPPNAPTAGGYLTITNTGDQADRLVSVASPEAATGEIHAMKVADGVMTMRVIDDGVEIPAGGSVTLAPGGFHLMFIDLKAPLAEGGEMPVTLTFQKAGSVDTFLDVMAIGARGPGAKHHGEDHTQ